MKKLVHAAEVGRPELHRDYSSRTYVVSFRVYLKIPEEGFEDTRRVSAGLVLGDGGIGGSTRAFLSYLVEGGVVIGEEGAKRHTELVSRLEAGGIATRDEIGFLFDVGVTDRESGKTVFRGRGYNGFHYEYIFDARLSCLTLYAFPEHGISRETLFSERSGSLIPDQGDLDRLLTAVFEHYCAHLPVTGPKTTRRKKSPWAN